MYEKDEARKQANVEKIEGFRPLISADIAFKNKIREEEVLNDIQVGDLPCPSSPHPPLQPLGMP